MGTTGRILLHKTSRVYILQIHKWYGNGDNVWLWQGVHLVPYPYYYFYIRIALHYR